MSNLIPRNNNRGMESGDLFRDFFGPRFMEGFFDGTGMQGIRADILDQKDAYEVRAEIPGVKKEDIQVNLEDGVLTISAHHDEETTDEREGRYIRRERRCGTMERRFRVDDVDESGAKAAYENGVLTIHLPKRIPQEPEKHTLPIE
ncbi:Hsp20/alpha crystallin family protein [Gehongia tenuis]|uniref:Hsp20/alpha crystallin family protein n=1 Tax=Gehongia tenuis TaxID=2763655 RepID=A0A926D292_9FIRM|nr:Hsp20/alpha crystallin family protein [Gehongia tenuis]MBC8530423.1 Hsp20/alpha crystallin family protein [Gehongia tenuis]